MKTAISLFKTGKSVSYKKNDLIPNPRQSNEIHLIKDGFINVYQLIHGEKKILLVLEPGNIFPIVDNLRVIKGETHYEAITPVKLKTLDSKKFFSKAQNDITYLKIINEQLVDYLMTHLQRIETLEGPKVQSKVIARLMHFEKRFAEMTPLGKKVKIPITHEFIASSINAARENVSREISKLQKKKIISLKNGELIILNSKRLHQLKNN